MRPGEGAPLAEVREAVLELRRGKGMVLDPADPDTVSAGSFFTNPILDGGGVLRARAARGAPAALPRARRSGQDLGGLADRARRLRPRLRQSGRIAISWKHTLAITNRGGGTTAELLALAREFAAGVEERFGVTLAARADARRRRLAGKRRGTMPS